MAPSRLRVGELIVGAGSALLLASMFLLPWYGVGAKAHGRTRSLNGWHGLTHLRWLILLTAVLGLALVVVQVTRRAPAVPVTMSVVVMVVALPSAAWVAYRVLIENPGSDKAGAYIGFACGLAIVYGAYRSMRQEGIRAQDGPKEIPTVSLSSPGS